MYIGIFSLFLPVLAIFFLRIVSFQSVIESRIALEQKASLLFSELLFDLTSAESVDVNASFFGIDDGILVYTDYEGNEITIHRPDVEVNVSGTTVSIGRLRRQEEEQSAEWLTDPNIDVTSWQIQAIRNTSGALTGLRFLLSMQKIAQDEQPRQSAKIQMETAYYLPPYTEEL